MKILPQVIFKEFQEKITNDSYYPISLIDALKARLTAIWMLQNTQSHWVKKAQLFLQKTSAFQVVDLALLEKFSAQIKNWDGLYLCSTYAHNRQEVIEYKLLYTNRDECKQIQHCHVQYEIQDHRYYFVAQIRPLIRIIGDSILHQPGLWFPISATAEQEQELSDQIECSKSALIQTGGAGIAANQCAAIEYPYRLIIVGIFYDSPEHVKGVKARYPTTKFPPARVMVNPHIDAVSSETQSFNHGCLSIPCANRSAVLSPMEIGVTYQDPLDKMKTKSVTFVKNDAVVLWHELNHILWGKTYIDVTFESLPLKDLKKIEKILSTEIQHRQSRFYENIPQLTAPPFHLSIKINAQGVPQLDLEELINLIPNISEDTLNGLVNRAYCVLNLP